MSYACRIGGQQRLHVLGPVTTFLPRALLDALLKAARRRQIDVVICWRLDRLGRSLRHLLEVLQELQALGVSFISLSEGLDATTPAGRLQMHLLGAFAQFERERIQERVRAGLARARRQGKRLGRPPRRITGRELASVEGLSTRAAARELRVSASQVHRARKARSNSMTLAQGVDHPGSAGSIPL